MLLPARLLAMLAPGVLRGPASRGESMMDSSILHHGQSHAWRTVALITTFYSIGAVITLYFKVKVPVYIPLAIFILLLILLVIPPMRKLEKSGFSGLAILITAAAGIMLGMATVIALGPSFGYVACF
jgi:hypothetical protein